MRLPILALVLAVLAPSAEARAERLGDPAAPMAVPAVAVRDATRVRPWKVYTHLYLAEEVLKDILDDGHVTILRPVRWGQGAVIGHYQVDPLTYLALASNSAQFRAGVIGPDAYPDIVTGQQVIHPFEAHPVPGGSVIGGTDSWLQHLVALSRTPAYDTPAVRAFVAGFLVHAVGDMYAHTMVNYYTGGTFSFSPEKRNAIKHVLMEEYIGKRTPTALDRVGRQLSPVDISIQGVEEFLYAGMIRADRGSPLDLWLLQGRDKGNSIPRVYSDLRNQLQREIDDYYGVLADYDRRIREKHDAAGACALTDLSCSAAALTAEAVAIGVEKTGFIALNGLWNGYREGWRDEIDRGLRALPAYSHRIMMALTFGPNRTADIDEAKRLAGEFVNLRFIPMRTGPTPVGPFAHLIGQITAAIVPKPVQDLMDAIVRVPLDGILQLAIGMTTDEVEQWVTAPQNHIDRIMPGPPGNPTSLAGVNVNELQLTDIGWASPGETFDWRRVPAAFNTVQMTKLVLMSPNARGLLFDALGIPMGMQGPPTDFLLGFIRSLDADNQWHINWPWQMYLSTRCDAYNQLFMRQTGEHGQTVCPAPAAPLVAKAEVAPETHRSVREGFAREEEAAPPPPREESVIQSPPPSKQEVVAQPLAISKEPPRLAAAAEPPPVLIDGGFDAVPARGFRPASIDFSADGRFRESGLLWRLSLPEAGSSEVSSGTGSYRVSAGALELSYEDGGLVRLPIAWPAGEDPFSPSALDLAGVSFSRAR